jgi:hypothetical protein
VRESLQHSPAIISRARTPDLRAFVRRSRGSRANERARQRVVESEHTVALTGQRAAAPTP